MALPSARRGPRRCLAAGMLLLALSPAAALGQHPWFRQHQPPADCPVAPPPNLAPCPAPPAQLPPGQPATPQQQPQPQTTPQAPTPGQPVPEPSEQAPAAPEAGTQAPSGFPEAPSGGGSTFAALGGDAVALGAAGGYLDPAVPFTHFRLRYDNAFDDNRPDRAEFFYPKCGCFRLAGIDPNAPGPPLPERRVDFAEASAYLEVAWQNKLSAFIDVPYRWLRPEDNAFANGIGDIQAGFKYAFVAEPCRYVTFQLRNYIPTGDPGLGLGTDHYSVEPGLLFYRQLTDRIGLQAQVEDWIGIGGTDFDGNVLNYGLGVSVIAYKCDRFAIVPVVETMGWTVLKGQEFDFPENVIRNAAGEEIVNVKAGVRLEFGKAAPFAPGLLRRSDLYAGYGRAVTGDVWYKEIFRVEYRVRF